MNIHSKENNDACLDRKDKLLADAILLKKWFGILFKIVIVSVVINIIANFVGDNALFSLIACIAEVAISIAYAYVLYALSKTNEKYLIAAIILIAVQVIDVVGNFFIAPTSNIKMIILSIVVIVVGMWSEYNEFVAHAEVMEEYDPLMSEKWIKLWNWYVISVFVTLVGLFVNNTITSIATIIVIVTSVLKIVYIYKSTEVYLLYVSKMR